MTTPLLIQFQVKERSGEVFEVRSEQDYWRLIKTIADVAIEVAANKPTFYPIFATHVLDSKFLEEDA